MSSQHGLFYAMEWLYQYRHILYLPKLKALRLCASGPAMPWSALQTMSEFWCVYNPFFKFCDLLWWTWPQWMATRLRYNINKTPRRCVNIHIIVIEWLQISQNFGGGAFSNYTNVQHKSLHHTKAAANEDKTAYVRQLHFECLIFYIRIAIWW